jgi:DNA-directed RNA polymerase sigma subunit (sigma70/sigma32)
MRELVVLSNSRDTSAAGSIQQDDLTYRRATKRVARESGGTEERQIIVERHLRHQSTTLKDLGARLGLSGESVRQMEMKALKAMRGMPAV